MGIGYFVDTQRPLLILDLDETLVYAVERPLERAADFFVGPYHVYLRPHLRNFLEGVASGYELAVWTSAGSEYAERIVRKVFGAEFGLKFVWSSERCVKRVHPETFENHPVKDLRKVTRRFAIPLERMVVVDDSPEKLQRNFGNLVRVRPFVGDEGDTELRDVVGFLEWLRGQENFRLVEKRNWRDRIRGGS